MNDEYDVVAEAEAVLAKMDASDGIDIDLSEEYVRAATQIHDKIGRPLTEDEAVAIFKEVTELFVSQVLWKGWEEGVLTMGFKDGEITWWPAS